MTNLISIKDKILSVRDQGQRPTCLAFAASEAHSIVHGLREWLSPEYLYQRAGERSAKWSYKNGLSLEKVIEAIIEEGQPHDIHCLYQEVECAQVQSVGKHTDTYKFRPKKNIPSSKAIIHAIRQGSIFVLGLRITDQFHRIKPPFIIGDEGKKVTGGHAMVLVGVDVHDDGTNLFLLKNTWGSSWGNEGFAWITEDFLNKNLIGTVEFKEI